MADRRIPPGELDAGGLADHAASAVAADEVLRAQRRAVRHLHVDAGVVLHEARHLTSAIDRHRQLVDPAGEDALDVVLPQREPVVVPRGKVADIQRDPGEARDLGGRALREEPIGDPALIEDLDRARVQAARARAGEVLAGAPFDEGDIDAGERQLAREHEPRRPRSDDHHGVLGHRRPSPIPGPTTGPTCSRSSFAVPGARIFSPRVLPGRARFSSPAIMGTARALIQASPCLLD